MRLIGKALWRGRLSEWGILRHALDIPFIRALTAVADCGRVKSMKENPCGGTLRTLPFRAGDSPALDTVSCRGLFLLHGVSVGGCFSLETACTNTDSRTREDGRCRRWQSGEIS